MTRYAHPAIDASFQSLIPPLSPDERAQLEANLIAEGCRDPLVVWCEKGILLDGHNRLEICQRLEIDYQVERLRFESRELAFNWIINNQLGRRNLHPDQASYLRGKRYNAEKKAASGRADRDFSGDQNDPPKTADRLATEYNVSPATIKRDGRFTQAVDTLAAAGIDPHQVVAHDTKASIVELAMAIAPEPEPPASPLIPHPPKPVDPVVATVTEQVKRGEISVMDASKKIRMERTSQRRAERIEKIQEISRGNADINIGQRFPVLYADPPWRYDYAESDNRVIENQYPTMSLDEICALPVADLATPDAVLFMWATSPKLADSMRVIQAWGFEYRTCAIWDKQKIGMGYYFRQQHELLLVATRGQIPAPTPDARPSSVISEARGVHSAKPARFAEIIEAMYPDLSRVELFCRAPRDGWTVWGNQSHAPA